jgi:D-glycero-alpha-D-manno-heptose 1-phosphate guanylyltransferase
MITAIILAGGLGTRLKDTVPDLPKPMAPINDRPFLEYQMDYWINQGVTEFILSVGYKREIIMNYFGKSYHCASIEYAVEENPLGTGGGLLVAAQHLTEPFLVLNGDTFIEVDLNEFTNFHRKSQSEWTFALFRISDSDRYMGMDINSDGKILSLQSTADDVNGLANGGVYLIEPSSLDRLEWKVGDSFSLEDQLLSDFLSSGGDLFGMECSGKFIDIGVPEDYHHAAKILI